MGFGDNPVGSIHGCFVGYPEGMLTSIMRGAASGAAGTTALNATTYLDMALRGRPTSSTPEQTVEKISEASGTEIPGDDQSKQSRESGLGALLGMVTGTAVGIGYSTLHRLGWRPPVLLGGLVAGVSAMVGSSAPMTVMGITDPRQWGAGDWLSDAVPHAIYGLVTAATYAQTEHGRRCRRRRLLGLRRELL